MRRRLTDYQGQEKQKKKTGSPKPNEGAGEGGIQRIFAETQ